MHISLGLFELFLEWQAKLSKKWYQRERLDYSKVVRESLLSKEFIEGTVEYNKEMTRLLKQHDDFMAPPFDDPVNEIFEEDLEASPF